jgi:hypothetical protein
LDRVEVIFDDDNLVANAGLVLPATLADRLALEAIIDDTVKLSGRVGGARPGRKVLTLVHSILAGGSHIDHADVLRAGATAAVLTHRVMAPSTLGTFLRAFTFGHVRQLEAVNGRALEHAWAAGAGPGDEPLTIDLDSTICEVAGHAKQGAAFGYTKVLGYHPILATRADTGEIVHARMRKGSANTQRGARRFIDELVARPPRRRRRARDDADGLGVLGQRHEQTLKRLDVRFTMAVRCGFKAVGAAIENIDENAWVDIAYPDGGAAQVAETTYTAGRHTLRLIVRRTRLTGRAQQRLWPDWRHHAFLTDIAGDAVEVDRYHRQHATIELAIRDLKQGAGIDHVPSRRFHANSAWLQCAVLAHNLTRWTALLGELRANDQLVVARTIRTRLLALPARLVNRSGRATADPTRLAMAHQFVTALNAPRDLQPATG